MAPGLGFKGGLFGIHTCCIHYRPSYPRAVLRGANGEHHAALCTRLVDDKLCSAACGVTRFGVHWAGDTTNHSSKTVFVR